MWVDIDIAGDGHKSSRLPASIDEAMKIVNSLPLQPSILVASGGGLHCYYIFKEPWELDTPEEKAKAAWLVLGIQTMLKEKNPQYEIDSTHDLSRVLRPVGTTNSKYNLPVQIIDCSDYRYSFDDLDQYAAEPTIRQIGGTVTRFERRPTDRPAETIINNCKFIEHCRNNAKSLPYPEWLTMLTNIGRASDGLEVAHELSQPYGKYSAAETNKKLHQALEFMNPTSCDYIQSVHKFNCPGGCGVKNPAGWALDSSKGKELALKKSADFNPVAHSDWRGKFGTVLEAYSINKRGELCMNKEITIDKAKMLIQVPISNFVARISKDIKKDDGVEIKALFEIEGFLSNGQPLPTVNVKAVDFDEMKWVIDVWGSDAIIYPNNGCKSLLRHAIQMVSMEDKSRQTIYCHTGWRKINNRWAYLHAGGAIGADNVTVDVTGEGDLSRYTLPAVTEKMAAAKMSLKLLEVADYKITIPLMALIFLTPLCEPLRQASKEPAFVVWMQGMTQSMKSSLAAVYLSHFGSFTGLSLPASFKDTAISAERKGNLLKDCLLVIDDFHPSATKAESQNMHKTAQSILRAWGDRRGRNRANIDGTLRASYPPKGMCLVTGEDLPDVGQSGTARYLAINLKRGDIDKIKLSEIQRCTDLLAQNMSSYLDWLSQRLDDIAETASDKINSIRNSLTNDGYDGRMPDMVASLFYGWSCAMKYFLEIGAVSEGRYTEMVVIGFNVLKEVAADHAETVKEEQPSLKFISALKEMIASGIVTTVDMRMGYEMHYDRGIGWRDDKACYLLPSVTFAHLTKFFDNQGTKFPVSKTALWQHLLNDGYIESGKDQIASLKKINGKAYRVICFKEDIFEFQDEGFP